MRKRRLRPKERGRSQTTGLNPPKGKDLGQIGSTVEDPAPKPVIERAATPDAIWESYPDPQLSIRSFTGRYFANDADADE